jgi:RecB family endonuclease NucS
MQIRQLSNVDKLARLQKMIKGIYYSDDNNSNIPTRQLKGGSSSSLISALDQHLLENINKNPQLVQEFLEAKEKEYKQKLGKLDRMIHPLYLQ